MRTLFCLLSLLVATTAWGAETSEIRFPSGSLSPEEQQLLKFVQEVASKNGGKLPAELVPPGTADPPAATSVAPGAGTAPTTLKLPTQLPAVLQTTSGRAPTAAEYEQMLPKRSVPTPLLDPKKATKDQIFLAFDSALTRLDDLNSRVAALEADEILKDQRLAALELSQQNVLNVIAAIQTEVDSWDAKFVELQTQLNTAIADSRTSEATIVDIKQQLAAAHQKVRAMQGQVAYLRNLARPGGLVRELFGLN